MHIAYGSIALSRISGYMQVRRPTIAFLVFITAWVCAAGQQAGPVRVQMRNIDYHFTTDIMVHVSQLSGSLISTREGMPPFFDDKDSFFIEVESAKTEISFHDLSNLLNTYVFAEKGSPLSKMSASAEKDKLKLKGTLHKGLDLPFETVVEVSATPEGKIRLHPKSVKAAHVPAKGFMDLFGVETADLINTKHTHGMRVEGEDLVMDPESAFPAPHLRGRITSVQVTAAGLSQAFGNPGQSANPSSIEPGLRHANFMAYRGATLRFGKLTMHDTDMVLIDMNSRNPFDFFLDHYKEQLVAGYTKLTPSFGLRVFMPDYRTLHASTTRKAGR